MQVAFPEHRIGRIEIHTQRLIGRSPVREVEVTLSDGTLLHGRADGDGVIALDFPSVPVSSVRIKITDVVPVPGNPPVGISEVVIPGVHLPIPKPDRALPCVSGPGLTLDGTPLSVRLEGTAEELLTGRDLAAASCEQTSFFVSAGRHELVGRGPLQPDTLVLSTASENLAATPPPPPRLEVRPARAGGYDVDVHGGRGPFYLVIGQNYSTAWRASVDGKSLGPPLLLDGYSAGWRIDRTGLFTVAVRFPPQRRYDLALAISGIALLAVLVLLAGPAIRRGRRTRKAWRPRRGRRVQAP